MNQRADGAANKRAMQMIGFTLLGVLAAAVPAMGADVNFALGKKEKEFWISAAEMLEDGQTACLLGSNFNPETLKSIWRVMLLDLAQQKVLWQHSGPVPDGNANMSLNACARHDGQIWVSANVNSNGKPDQNWQQIYLYRFTTAGKLAMEKRLDFGEQDAVSHGFLPTEEGLQMLGLLRRTEDNGLRNALFFAKVSDTAKPETKLIDKGGYAHGTSARVIGKHVFIGGEFWPQKSAKDDIAEDYAMSKLRIGGNYVWSTHPGKEFWGHVRTLIAADGSLFGLGVKKEQTVLMASDAVGKATLNKEYKGKFCDIKAALLVDDEVLAVRKPCAGDGKKNVLTSINSKTGVEQEATWLKQSPVALFGGNGGWFVVVRDDGGNLVVRQGKQGH